MRNLLFFLLSLAATLIVGFAAVQPAHMSGMAAPRSGPRIAGVTPGTAMATPLPADQTATGGSRE
jgi:hypothetical protein